MLLWVAVVMSTVVAAFGSRTLSDVREEPIGQYGYGSSDESGGYGLYGVDDDVFDQSVARAPVPIAGVDFDRSSGCGTCLDVFEQCAGGTLVRVACCRPGLICAKKNAYYGQCLTPTRRDMNVADGWNGAELACGQSTLD